MKQDEIIRAFTHFRLKNYKCFEDSGKVEFQLPDKVTPGSGLNLFIGENNSGKTSLLQSLLLLKNNKTHLYTIPRVIDSGNFQNPDMPISIELDTRWRDGKITKISAEVINDMSPGKQVKDLSEEGTIDFYASSLIYFSGDTFPETLSWKQMQSDMQILDQYTSGMHSRGLMFKDAFEMNPQKFIPIFLLFGQEFTFNSPKKYAGEMKEEILAMTKKVLDIDDYKAVIQNDQFILFVKHKGHFRDIKQMGSGIRNLFFLMVLLRCVHREDTIFIDEPENTLHPQAQKRLLNLLLEESKNRQIFIATHSAEFITPLTHKNILRFHLNDTGSNVDIFPREGAQDVPISEKDLETLVSIGNNRSVFFSPNAIWVEGIGDRIIFEAFFKKLAEIKNTQFMAEFFSLDTKENSQKAFYLSEKFGIPFAFILDGDAINESKGKNTKKFIEEKNKERHCFHLMGNENEALENFFEKKHFNYPSNRNNKIAIPDALIVRDKILECGSLAELKKLFSDDKFKILEGLYLDLV